MSSAPVPPPRAIPSPFDRHLARRLLALDADALACCVAVLVDVDPRIEGFLEAFVMLAEPDFFERRRGRATPGLAVIKGGRC